MIEVTKGNLLLTDAEALVNTVNCVGYMGKGIALQFKKAFPDNFKAYQKACDNNEVMPGRMHVFHTGKLMNPRYIINFPTKRHWKGNSKIEDIESGLKALVQEVSKLGITSIAIPPLGCGYGGLQWRTVRPMIEKAFAELSDVRVMLFAPLGTPDPKTMPVGTEKPHLTPARALILELMFQYLKLAYRLTLLEIHKLAYFLQEAEEPLRLKYEEGPYGPYADNLKFLLEKLEGHYIRGHGDNEKPDQDIELLPGSKNEAEEFLAYNESSLKRLGRVAALIEGFETPYGMELLSSVHWVAVHRPIPAKDKETAIKYVYGWNKRKKMFKPEHIELAWDRLKEEGWLSNDSCSN